jgi:hypothetical protein
MALPNPNCAASGKGKIADSGYITSVIYYDWLVDHVFLMVPAQAFVAEFLATFKDYPQRQKAASFNLDEVLRKAQEGVH